LLADTEEVVIVLKEIKLARHKRSLRLLILARLLLTGDALLFEGLLGNV
jgi:hypothetical protein